MTDGTQNFVESMLENAKKKKEKPKAQGRCNVDHEEVENILENIQKDVQSK